MNNIISNNSIDDIISTSIIKTETETSNAVDKIENNFQTAQKGNDFLTKIGHLIEKNMNNFASLFQKKINNVIEKTPLSKLIKTELIKDIDESISETSSIVKSRLESFEDEREIIINKNLPIAEKRFTSFLNNIISKIKNFADETVKNCENNINKLGDKIKFLVSDNSNLDNNLHSKEDIIVDNTNKEMSGISELSLNLLGEDIHTQNL